ncbi:MAG TPA: benzoate-CoA ligase family protein [Pyrinomonadaceae bacterium]|nr:benzoate-CoA ligase family protein [Pyrinomonadaceae bacterium]
MDLFDAIFDPATRDLTAILFEDRTITYAELREKTIQVNAGLNRLHVSRGDRVALLMHDSPEFVSTFLAICSLGAIAVPVNMALRIDEQKAILNDCGAQIAVVEQELMQAFLDDESVPALSTLVVVKRDEETKTVTQASGGKIYMRVVSLEELVVGMNSASLSTSSPGPDAPAFIFYTSGSTGEPKGAVHREADAFYTNETYCRQVLKPRPGDRMFSSSRLPFSYGFGNAFTFPLLNGCTTILCREKPNAEIIAEIFATYKPTIFFGVPVIYRLLLDHHRDVAAIDFSSLRLCVSAGEALPAALGEEVEHSFGVEVLDGIGSTEMFHMWMSNYEGEIRYGSSGKLVDGYEARLLDQEGGPSPAGEEGNLWVKGASAALGYWQKPETTAATFVDGWVRTGDLYRQDADGYWFHMGRSDDCFKSSGQWVSPVEVEGVLIKEAGVNRAAVVADFDENNLPCACAFVVPQDVNGDNSGLESRLRQLARAHLPRFKQPRRYVFVDDLPYTATGKIQRFKLRERLRKVSSFGFRVSS